MAPLPIHREAKTRPEHDTLLQSHLLVASFLSAQGYTSTLASFRLEAGAIFASASETRAPTKEVDLREVVDDYLEKKMRSLQVKEEESELEEQVARLSVKEDWLPTQVAETVRDSTNVLTVKSGVFPERTWDTASSQFKAQYHKCVFTTSVDRTLKVYLHSPSLSLHSSFPSPSPILSFASHPSHPRLVLLATMEGTLLLLDLVTREIKQKLKDHDKYIVKVAWSDDGKWVATAGYDKRIRVYEVVDQDTEKPEEQVLLDGEEPDELAICPSLALEMRCTLDTKTNPEAITFLPNSSHLVWSARDDHVLHYLSIPANGGERESGWEETGWNLNENGDKWVSFSVLHITLHPTLPLLALQTSTDNARILLYPFHSSTRLSTLYTTASQSDFSTPRHAWLPDGTALVCTSEDGSLRVVDLKGKLVGRIGAHGAVVTGVERDKGAGEVVKDVAVLEKEGGGWRFVSVGFDKTVRVCE